MLGFLAVVELLVEPFLLGARVGEPIWVQLLVVLGCVVRLGFGVVKGEKAERGKRVRARVERTIGQMERGDQ